MAGYPDFRKWSGRRQEVLKSEAPRNIAKRNYPFNLELTNIVDGEFRQEDWDLRTTVALFADMAEVPPPAPRAQSEHLDARYSFWSVRRRRTRGCFYIR